MKPWQEDLVANFDDEVTPQGIFHKVEEAARALGFEYCAYGARAPLPLANPKLILLNNYPNEWRSRYEQAKYINIDPSVLHGRRSRAPVVWSDKLFAETPALWNEAQSFGLRVGWAQSILNSSGVAGMLTLARSQDALRDQELQVIDAKLRWLAQITHSAMSQALGAKLGMGAHNCLTDREIEVLKWTADGKTSAEISTILSISDHTVNFHVKNAISKLGVANKTAAVVQAAVLGMLV
jgi:LuxR family transcriptional regulator, quorum-sensing system regulator SolR